RRRCDSLAEVNRGRGAWRRELHAPERVANDEVGVEPPAQVAVKALGAIDVRDGDGGDLELHVDGSRALYCSFAAHLSRDGHVGLFGFDDDDDVAWSLTRSAPGAACLFQRYRWRARRLFRCRRSSPRGPFRAE